MNDLTDKAFQMTDPYDNEPYRYVLPQAIAKIPVLQTKNMRYLLVQHEYKELKRDIELWFAGHEPFPPPPDPETAEFKVYQEQSTPSPRLPDSPHLRRQAFVITGTPGIGKCSVHSDSIVYANAIHRKVL